MNPRFFGSRWLLLPIGGILAAGALVFSGSLITAQTPEPSPTQPATPSPTPSTTTASPNYDDILAEELGIDVNELREAQSNARARYFDQLVDAGELTAAEAADLKASSPGQREMIAGHPNLDVVREFVLNQVANVLDMDRDQLEQDLEDGKSFDEIAEEQGLSGQEIRSQLESSITRLIDLAAQTGFLDAEDATELKANLGDILSFIFNQDTAPSMEPTPVATP